MLGCDSRCPFTFSTQRKQHAWPSKMALRTHANTAVVPCSGRASSHMPSCRVVCTASKVQDLITNTTNKFLRHEVSGTHFEILPPDSLLVASKVDLIRCWCAGLCPGSVSASSFASCSHLCTQQYITQPYQGSSRCRMCTYSGCSAAQAAFLNIAHMWLTFRCVLSCGQGPVRHSHGARAAPAHWSGPTCPHQMR